MAGPKKLTMDHVSQMVMELARRRKRFIPETLAKDITELVVQAMLTQTIETGGFKFRSGWGAMRLTVIHRNPSKRVMPGGETVHPTARGAVRYDEGSVVRDLLGLERRPADFKPAGEAQGRTKLLIKDGVLLPDA